MKPNSSKKDTNVSTSDIYADGEIDLSNFEENLAEDEDKLFKKMQKQKKLEEQ